MQINFELTIKMWKKKFWIKIESKIFTYGSELNEVVDVLRHTSLITMTKTVIL